MKVFIAGASGTIGIPLVRALVAGGHEVSAMTRSPEKRGALQALGASAVVADALHRQELIEAVERARSTHVIHQLTALPPDGPRRKRDLEATNKLRIEGTRNLLDAAILAGAERFVVGSFAPLAPRGDSRFGDDAAAAAVASMETQVLDASRRGEIEGAILRYGMFFSLESPSTLTMIQMVRKRLLPVVRNDASLLPFIHLDDAVAATVLALDHAPAGAVYEIVCDQAVSLSVVVETLAEYTGAARPRKVPAWLPRLIAPTMARLMSRRMPLSNAKARAELGWRLKYPMVQDGLAEMFEPAA